MLPSGYADPDAGCRKHVQNEAGRYVRIDAGEDVVGHDAKPAVDPAIEVPDAEGLHDIEQPEKKEGDKYIGWCGMQSQ